MQLSPMILTFTQLGDDRRPFLESLDMTAAAGYREVSLLSNPGGPAFRRGSEPAMSFIDVFRSDWSALQDALAERSLGCRHIHAGGLDVSTDDTAAVTAESLIDFAVACHNFGARVMSFGIGPRLPLRLAWEEKVAYLDRAVHAFQTMAAGVAGLPIRLGVDIHFRAPVETVRDAAYVLENSDQNQIGLCLNTGHLRSSNESGWELIERFPEAIAVLAYKDHTADEGVHSVRLGAGDTPLDRYVTAVRTAGIAPYQVVSIEHESWEDKQTSAQESREYLEALAS